MLQINRNYSSNYRRNKALNRATCELTNHSAGIKSIFHTVEILFFPLNWFFNFIVLLILIALFVPLTPKMPALALDPSWALALNQAVAQGLAFGKQIIFTLGPYSSIYTSMYHPATDGMMIWGSLYWACSYWVALLYLRIPQYWRMALALFLLTLVYSKDSLFFSYPLLVGVISFGMIYFKYKSKEYLTCIVLFAPLGLMPLVKGSLLILSVLVSLLCAVLFFLYRKPLCALLTIIVPISSLCFFWVIAGQSLFNVPAYMSSSMLIASDFSEAMSKQGSSYEIFAYLIASSILLLVILWQKQIPWLLRGFLFSLFFLFLFLSFKAGFVRHFGHAFIPGTSIFLAALLIPSCAVKTRMVPIVAVLACLYIDAQYTHISIFNNIHSLYATACHGLWSRIQDKDWAKKNFDVTVVFLAQQAHFPILSGTTDLYSYEQSALIASDNIWDPRPIFQSYSVFNAQFAQLNRHHLVARNSPEYLFFKIEPIDQRIPSLEDGVSWPVLLSHYEVQDEINNFLLLHKRTIALPAHNVTDVSVERHHLGEKVIVPHTHQLLFVSLDIQMTNRGKIINFLFKPQDLWLQIALTDGTKKDYRVIASMAQSGFLLSPFIEQTKEFALLYQHPKLLAAKQVKSFRLVSTEQDTWQWQNEYQIHFWHGTHP